MKRALIASLVTLGIVACASLIPAPPVPVPGVVVIEAQSLPYTLTVAWNAPVDGNAITYTCYLDGVAVVSGVTGLTCQMPAATLGSHTVGVTSNNPAFIPSESVPATLTFKLQQPGAPASIKVK